MKILALDTSSRYLCLGLINGRNFYEYRIDTGVALSRVLVPAIERVLAAAGMSVADIEYYAAGLGPGSFTALRIGHAAVKALAWANRRPVIGIPTLEILAAHPGIPDGLVIPVVDAKRSLVYCGWYVKSAGGIRRAAPDRLLSFDRFISGLSKIKSAHKGKRIIIGGDGLNVCADRIKAAFPEAALLEKDFWYPQSQTLISLSLRQIHARKLTNAFELEPIYLYPQECQIKTARK
ncbi:MAG: tRNA (adenosine(37)-N6)-threonylcarbamoyltransferase complex dimerization subunit type 1 TsaB [Candidatus Omnitrophota bacterium]